MGTSNLSASEIANIQRVLAIHAMSRGRTILGAQLGELLNSAIRPKTVREFGGMRRFVQAELHDAVRLEGPDSASLDLLFTILGPGDRSPATVSQSGIREVAGQDLWKIFANPNVADQLVVAPSGAVLVLPPHEPIPEGYQPLTRPSSDDYRTLARQFAEIQDAPEVRSALMVALAGDDFYKGFISELRALRTPTENVLKKWETSRAEFVTQKLLESLVERGVANAKGVEIVSLARPIIAQPRPKAAAVTSKSAGSNCPLDLESTSLRSILHHAIDLMGNSELRELKVPVGIFLDATRRAQR
ncbi:MAG: hypothetical protein V5B35_09680 [Candidatus Accumulibacter necessarius]|jgi:hypothetical protein|uniref:hypothetical protein n=1 Tax=Candidatus Accumulibacter necessarius TaxID=2954386 RepID=UPI002FC306A4